MFERTFTAVELEQLEIVRGYLRASVAHSRRKPLLIFMGLLFTAIEVGLRLGIEKEVLAVHLRKLADHTVNGTCPHFFAPDKLELKGLEKK